MSRIEYPVVSVLTTVYNREKYIAEVIDFDLSELGVAYC